jgi:hypothetical protein
MTVYSKQSYEDQDDGRILKAARKQQYIIFPASIAFLNDEKKAELGMKSKNQMMQSFAHSRFQWTMKTNNQRPMLSRSRNMIQECQKSFRNGV